jgi:putative transposase
MAAAYRLEQWSLAMQEKNASEMTVKAFCQAKGVSRNTYFYWQRRLREAVCRELSLQQDCEAIGAPTSRSASAGSLAPVKAVAPNGWAVCEVAKVPPADDGAVVIEIGQSRVRATAGTDTELLARVCRMLVSIC